jgi:hypothetical protein
MTPRTPPRGCAAGARNQVDVHMRDGLPGYVADIDTDVESVWLMLALQQILALLQQGEQRLPFVGGGLEEVRDLAPGDEQDVSWRHWKHVPARDRQFIGEHGLALVAEGAGRVGHECLR